MQHTLFNYPGLDVRAGSVFDLIFETSSSGHEWGRTIGIRLGEQISLKKIISLLMAGQTMAWLSLVPRS